MIFHFIQDKIDFNNKQKKIQLIFWLIMRLILISLISFCLIFHF